MNPVLHVHLQKKIQSNTMTYLNLVLLTPSTIFLPHLLQVFNQKSPSQEACSGHPMENFTTLPANMSHVIQWLYSTCHSTCSTYQDSVYFLFSLCIPPCRI